MRIFSNTTTAIRSKADGLAAGKGVLIIQDLAEAQTELRNMLVGQNLALREFKSRYRGIFGRN